MLNFVLIKSISMSLGGIRGVLLAMTLGPASFGLYGTLIAVQQYLSYLALGAREGVAIRLARPDGTWDIAVIYSSALYWGVASGTVCFLSIVSLTLAGAIPAEAVWIGLIGLCSIVNEILININRHENRLGKIAMIELGCNVIVLTIVLALWTRITVAAALQAVLLGTAVSAAIYLGTLRSFRWSAASMRMIRHLLNLGVRPALFSACLIAANSIFVVAAGLMKLGDQTGFIAFGNSIVVMIFFGLNAASWGLASRAMQRLFAQSESAGAQADRSDVLFRFGVVAAVILALGAQLAVQFVLTEYSQSAIYILLLCLFQAYGVLLVNEFNYLNVHLRLKQVTAGYALLLLVISVVSVTIDPSRYPMVIQIGVVLYFLLSLGVTASCARLGFRSGPYWHRVVWLLFPVSCTAFHAIAGSIGVLIACALGLMFGLCTHGTGRRVYDPL